MQPTFEEQEILAEKRRRARLRMSLREILGELLVGPGFFAGVALVWWIQPPHHIALAPAACCIAVMVLATRVLFETPFGFTVATQLAFVPMLFAVPLAIVPLAFARHVSDALPQARHVELDCGHVPQVERPRQTHEEIARFLSTD